MTGEPFVPESVSIPGTPLAVVTERIGPATVVHLSGEVDMSTAGLAVRALDEAIDGEATILVVDLTDVGFLGSAGLSVLVRLHRRTEHLPVEVRLATAQRAVLRPMRITQVDSLFPIHPTVADALAAVS